MSAEATMAAGSALSACPLCAETAGAIHGGWLWRCQSCGFLFSTLTPRILNRDSARVMDELRRADGLRELREANFATVLDRLAGPVPTPADLLEVGCAHGWFLRMAADRGYRVTGLEPDPVMQSEASAGAGDAIAVIDGFFPDAVADRIGDFDVIGFNDVFEHLPDVDAAAAACHRLLRDGGVLMINLPSARGIIYLVASLLSRIGIAGPLERLWQKGLPSPHMSYFTPNTLRSLMDRHGLREIARGRLRTLTAAGLWDRITCVGGVSRPAAIAQWCAAMALLPVLRILPPDITFQIFRKSAGNG